MFLYKGIQYLNEYNYEISKDAFRESLMLYYGLKDTTKIEEDTREIFKTYWKISDFFYEYVPTIERLRKKNITKLNSLIKMHLHEFIKDLPKLNLRVQRIIKNIEKIQFDSKSKYINQLKWKFLQNFVPNRQ